MLGDPKFKLTKLSVYFWYFSCPVKILLKILLGKSNPPPKPLGFSKVLTKIHFVGEDTYESTQSEFRVTTLG